MASSTSLVGFSVSGIRGHTQRWEILQLLSV